MRSKRRAWAVMATVFLASIAIAANRFKVPPVMQVLMEDLDVGMVTGGWLMSVMSIAGILLAIPAALVISRLGLKVTGLVALGCAALGSVLGAISDSATALLATRALEGIGNALIAVAAPTAIAMWFEPKDRGLPLGIWATWVPIGNALIFNLADPLLDAFGWRSIWWLCALLALLAFVLYGLAVAAPPRKRVVAETPSVPLAQLLGNPTTWLLALGFGFFGFSVIGYNTWAPTYLSASLGLDTATASFYGSLMFVAGIPANILAGWVSGLTKRPYRLLALAYLLSCAIFAWSFSLSSPGVVGPYMIVLGLLTNVIPSLTFVLAPETMPSGQAAGLAIATMIAVSYLGALVGPPALGAIISDGNWGAGGLTLVILMGFGTIAVWFASRKVRTAARTDW